MARKIIVLRPRVEDGVVYMDCMKNHVALFGLHAVDGCGEFMASAPSLDRPEEELTFAGGSHRDYHMMVAVEDLLVFNIFPSFFNLEI